MRAAKMDAHKFIGGRRSLPLRNRLGANKMGVEKDTYENPSVNRIVANVRAGIRSKRDLEICGCSVCREALKILEASE